MSRRTPRVSRRRSGTCWCRTRRLRRRRRNGNHPGDDTSTMNDVRSELRSELPPAVFLARDGVPTRTPARGGTPCPPGKLDEVEVLPGVEDALRRLRGHGLPLIVVTNQPDVARGTQTRAAVE